MGQLDCKQGLHHCFDLGKLSRGCAAFFLRLSCLPVQRFHLVCQNRGFLACDLCDNLKWVALDFGGHRATHHQSGGLVVVGGSQDQRWPVATLFVARLSLKTEPNNVSHIWNVLVGFSQRSSFPTLEPRSVSAWRFLSVIRVINWSRSRPLFSCFELRQKFPLTYTGAC